MSAYVSVYVSACVSVYVSACMSYTKPPNLLILRNESIFGLAFPCTEPFHMNLTHALVYKHIISLITYRFMPSIQSCNKDNSVCCVYTKIIQCCQMYSLPDIRSWVSTYSWAFPGERRVVKSLLVVEQPRPNQLDNPLVTFARSQYDAWKFPRQCGDLL